MKNNFMILKCTMNGFKALIIDVEKDTELDITQETGDISKYIDNILGFITNYDVKHVFINRLHYGSVVADRIKSQMGDDVTVRALRGVQL